MPTRDINQDGFTLIEILVVIIILGITIFFASLAVGDFGKSREIKLAGEQFINLIQLAKQQAMLEPSILGINFENHGYAFYRFEIDPKNYHGRWRLLQHDPVLHFHSLPSHCDYHINASNSHRPQIKLSSTGEITPFILDLNVGKNSPVARIIASSNGVVTLK